MRWGLGPVFFYECLAGSRRWQNYAARSIAAALLLAAMATIASSRPEMATVRGWREYAALGESYFYAIIGVELTLVMLAAPAATAGAICVDRARGTLTHVLATDLSDPEIVLGKLAARLLPILGLVACSWPVLSVCSLLGGIDPTALTLAFAIMLAVALFGCAMAMALSVWARKAHEGVLVVYTVWMLVLLLWPLWYALSRTGYVRPPDQWSLVADPFYLAFAPYSTPGRVGFEDYLGFFGVTLTASAALVVLAVWRMRPVARRGTDENRKGTGLGPVTRLVRWLPGPSLDANPVLWREWHRSRPSRWTLILVVLIGGSTGVACLIGAYSAWRFGLGARWTGPIPELIAAIMGLTIQLIFGLLMLSAVAPMSMSEERQRGSLDLLAATTLSTPTIVIGKWLGALRPVVLLVISPAVLGFALAAADRPPEPVPAGMPPRDYLEMSGAVLFVAAGLLVATILVHGALIASVGLALAVWMKRQGRAIAFSVGFAVLVGAGWPIFILVGRMGPDEQGLASLSPVMAAGNLVGNLGGRRRDRLDLNWWAAFWDVECLVLALGLLWLTVRTFDGCFGRMPERPRRASVLSDVIVVLAALLGAGGLFAMIVQWTWRHAGYLSAQGGGIRICIFLAVIGFGLASALAASSMSRKGAGPAATPEPGPWVLDRRTAARRWWEAARLVLLLAIGPALVAVAIATTPTPFQVVRKETPLPGGGWVVIDTDRWGDTNVTTTDGRGVATTIRAATAEEIAEAGVAPPAQARGTMLMLAAVAIATVLAHGLAFVSLGAALGIAIRRRRLAIAASAGLVLFATVGWPILFDTLGWPILYNVFRVGDEIVQWGIVMGPESLLLAYGDILRCMNTPEPAAASAWRALCWDGILILVAAFAGGRAVRMLDRRARGATSDAEPLLQPAVVESGSASIWGRVAPIAQRTSPPT
jgi:ABC-type transport system involved in multi-copper enzyme maturation permease subunit